MSLKRTTGSHLCVMNSDIESTGDQTQLNTFTDIYDISIILGEESIDYPRDTPFSLKHLSTFEDRGDYDLSSLTMRTHSGTHLDFPAHFIPGGKTADDYATREFIRPARVIDIQ